MEFCFDDKNSNWFFETEIPIKCISSFLLKLKFYRNNPNISLILKSQWNNSKHLWKNSK